MLLLDTLRSQFAETTDAARAIADDIAGMPDGIATDEQAANLDALNTTLEGLTPRIEQAPALADRMHAGAELLAGVPNVDASLDRARSTNVELAEFSGWGDYCRALAAGNVYDATMRAVDRATLAIETRSRAFADVTTTQVPGILPPTWLTDILDFIGTARPFVETFHRMPLPDSGMNVSFPTVTTKPQVGKQTAEKTDIPSRATTIVAGSAPVETYGGGEDVSVQVIARTDPSYLAIANELYAEQMAIAEDQRAIAVALAAIPVGPANNVTLSAAAPEAWIPLLTTGAATIYGGRAVPNAFVVGLNLWGAFAGAVDADGRPLFSNVSPSNSAGSASLGSTSGDVRGLGFVLDPNMQPDTGVLGWSRAFTTMLGGVQTMRADNPVKLGVDYAVFEFSAYAVRRPSAMVKVTLGA